MQHLLRQELLHFYLRSIMLSGHHAVVRLRGCGGVCVRGGQRHWLHLLEVFPDRYAEAEAEEQQLRAELGDVAILRERRSGVSRPLTLTELRRHQRAPGSTDP
jgi:hypothetical protein